MDVYVKVNSNNRTYYKGFPVVSENSRKTAIEWSGTDKPIEFPDELENLCVDGIEDRMNNKIFKLYALRKIDNKMCRVYFDMYADAMLDVLQYGSVSEGVIKSPVVVIGRSKLTAKGGELHQEYLKNIAIKNTKALSVKELEVGKVYGRTGPSEDLHLYLGRVKGVGHLVMGLNRYRNSKPALSEWDIRLSSSPNLKFKNEDNISFSKVEIIDVLSKAVAKDERYVSSTKRELEEYRKGQNRYYWKSEEYYLEKIEKEQATVDKYKKALDYAKSLDIA